MIVLGFEYSIICFIYCQYVGSFSEYNSVNLLFSGLLNSSFAGSET